MAKIFFFLFVLLLGHFSLAAEEGQIRFGGQAGNVGPADKVNGTDVGNAMGAGAIFNFAVTDEMMLEIAYTGSNHNHLKHTNLGAGINFFFNSYDPAYFYLSAGADFNNHVVEIPAGDKSATGFGLYAGLGVDFDLGKNFSTGLQAIYHNSFGSNIDFPPSVNVIPNYTTVMLRLLFVIPPSK
ncbi:MAG: outer membrane beta-barrel protein [Bdellovibrionia bacterium]